jgi:hypothetical protein
LILNDSSFIQLTEEVPLTKYLFERICGDEIANVFYHFSIKLNSLNLTSKELALVLPVALTLPGCSNFKKFDHSSKNYFFSRFEFH